MILVKMGVIMQQVIRDLKEFKLAGMAYCLEERLSYAQTNKLSYQELLELLCEDEKSSRRDNSFKRRKNAAKLPSMKRLEDFDFGFQPSIDQQLVSTVATCQFINSKENISHLRWQPKAFYLK